jgi:hypothetical protein
MAARTAAGVEVERLPALVAIEDKVKLTVRKEDPAAQLVRVTGKHDRKKVAHRHLSTPEQASKQASKTGGKRTA